MILEALRSRIQWLERQLSELISGKRTSETERDECCAAIDGMRKYARDQEDALQSIYHSLTAGSNQIKGTRFRREYQLRLREILFGTQTAKAFDTLEEGISEAKAAHQKAEDDIAVFNRRIRETEDELSYSRIQMAQQEEVN